MPLWWLNLPVLAELAIVVGESPDVVAEFLPRQQQPVLGDCTTTMEILVPVRSVRTVPGESFRLGSERLGSIRFGSYGSHSSEQKTT